MTVLGVMVSRVDQPSRFQPYDEVAREAGFQHVLVFRPSDVNLRTKKVTGYLCIKGNWEKRVAPIPPMIFDVGYYNNPLVVAKVRQLKKSPACSFLNYGLGNKWLIHQKLFRYEQIRPFLIPTERVTSSKQVMEWVKRFGIIMLKPINGKEGKGIVRLTHTNNGYLLEEQDEKRNGLSAELVVKQIERLLQSRQYIVQKWIPIVNRQGLVFDVRSLVQKNQSGKWEVTGLAVREGAEGKITSNLMDGGTPHEMMPYLKKQFGGKKSRQIDQKIKQISLLIPNCIEEAYQNRQADLGLDIAVDTTGGLYLIEVNVKPGKLPFRGVFGIETKQQSIRHPIWYAAYLLGLQASAISV